MDNTYTTSQDKALQFWAWALWIAFASWLANHSPMQDDWDLLLFTFIAIIPKGLRGALYCGTERQNRYSEGYTESDKHLPLYWLITKALFVVQLGQIIWSGQLLNSL